MLIDRICQCYYLSVMYINIYINKEILFKGIKNPPGILSGIKEEPLEDNFPIKISPIK